VEAKAFFDQVERLDLSRLRQRRSDLTDRLPRLPVRPARSVARLAKRHRSSPLPVSLFDVYMVWLARRRYLLNVTQIDQDELDELAGLDCDSTEEVRAVYRRHAERRLTARFFVATLERRRLERLARGWDIDAPPMIARGEADEAAIAQVRRAVREARWNFAERCVKVLIPIVSVVVALAALLVRMP
jgi:hypothetical protein